MEEAPTEKMKVYNEYFEVPFLKATREYYKSEALFFIRSHSMLEYIRKVIIATCMLRIDEYSLYCYSGGDTTRRGEGSLRAIPPCHHHESPR